MEHRPSLITPVPILLGHTYNLLKPWSSHTCSYFVHHIECELFSAFPITLENESYKSMDLGSLKRTLIVVKFSYPSYWKYSRLIYVVNLSIFGHTTCLKIIRSVHLWGPKHQTTTKVATLQSQLRMLGCPCSPTAIFV